MKKALLALILFSALTNCSKENEIQNSPNQENNLLSYTSNEITSKLLDDYNIPEQDIFYLQKLGFSGSPAKVYENFDSTTNETYTSYVLENDIEIKSEDLITMIPEELLTKGGGLASQYRTTITADSRTYNVIYDPPTILFRNKLNIIHNTDISWAIDMAIQNYNQLNLGIRFQRVNIPSYSGSGKTIRNSRNKFVKENHDIIIRHRNTGDAGGSAGFPKRITLQRPFRRLNVPHNEVKIDVSTVDFGLNVLEHVITHEIGHCIGLRHTDFFNRTLSGCPRYDDSGNDISNEGQSSSGAIHIPGTPATNNIDRNSIMGACFGAGETGEFTNFDITALRALW